MYSLGKLLVPITKFHFGPIFLPCHLSQWLIQKRDCCTFFLSVIIQTIMNWFPGFSFHYFASVCKTKRNQFIIKCQQGQSLEYTCPWRLRKETRSSKERNMIGKGDQTAYFQQNDRRAGNGFNMTQQKRTWHVCCVSDTVLGSVTNHCNLKYKNLFLSKLWNENMCVDWISWSLSKKS